ncbi:hypothetical protein HMPREF1981_02597 [Bacteroides pyogenes F0041]|uniref:Uncharacterized protein n=1 Tax=Bacteroides pyogenes F0041 TaxID=1321819 RepID=U2CH24_9BACE|nr:hypothetical protein HMPREF1981_02597 [Bacteroides pyogenes F0041]
MDKKVIQTVKGKILSAYGGRTLSHFPADKKPFPAFFLSLYIFFHSERRKYLWHFLFVCFFSLFVSLLFAWF